MKKYEDFEHDNGIEEKRINYKGSPSSFIISENLISLLLFIYLVLSNGGSLGGAFSFVFKFPSLILRNFPGNEILIPLWTFFLFSVLMYLIFSFRSLREKIMRIEKFFVYLVLISLFIVLLSSFFIKSNAGKGIDNELEDQSNSIIYNFDTFYKSIYCSVYGDFRGEEKCLKKKGTERASSKNEYYSITLDQTPYSIKKVSIDSNSINLFVKYEINGVELNINSYSCYFGNDDEPFFVSNNLDQKLRVSKLVKYECGSLDKIFKERGTSSVFGRIFIAINYSVKSSLKIPIPAINCQSDYVLGRLSDNRLSCSDINYDNFRRIIPSWNPSLTPDSTNSFNLEIRNLKYYLPVKLGDPNPEDIYVELLFRRNNNGDVIKVSNINLIPPGFLQLKDSSVLNKEYINEGGSRNFLIAFEFSQLPISNLNDDYTSDSIYLDYDVYLTKRLYSKQIRFENSFIESNDLVIEE